MRKGYRLEGTVCGVLGFFTRGPAQGGITLETEPETAQTPIAAASPA